jgi:peptidoglycan/xylan/chitin deacetylase (PgdA/CDA1 family)
MYTTMEGDSLTAGDSPLSRRRVLGAGLATAGTLLLATGSASDTRPPMARAVAAVTPTSSPLPSPTPGPAPSPLPVQARPVFTLADYRQVVPGPAFPTDAVALTIDDGPHPVWTPKILNLLDQHHVPARFCLIGNQVLGHEAVARSVVAAGHQVANHTWSHPSALAHFPDDKMRAEIERAQDKIYSTTGQTPTLFRSPGGAWSPSLFAGAAAARMVPLDWSDDPRDWTRPGVQSIISTMVAVRPGQILLCHDGGGDRSQTFTALQTVIPTLQARGYQFVAL